MADNAAPIAKLVSDHYAVSFDHALHYEVAGLAAALDELSSVAVEQLEPATARRWFAGEALTRRVLAPHERAVGAHPSQLPAAILAWCATACVAGSEVVLRCNSAVHPVFSKVFSCSSEDYPWPVQLVNDDGHAPTDAEILPATIAASAAASPSLAWLDDLASIERSSASLLCAARYAGGAHRGALRWIAAKSSVIDALVARWNPRVKSDATAFERDGVRCVLGPLERDIRERANTVVLEAFDNERAFVEKALAAGPWSAACGFGRDAQRARSIALRTGAQSTLVNATPADALGGMLRVDFDARRWLTLATQLVCIAEGPTPSLARVEEGSSLRASWLRRWLRITLGRYGIGGTVDDLW